MSRSYKKFPVSKDNPRGSKKAKSRANRQFRRSCPDNIPLKSAYHRKYTESWNIHDYICYWTMQEAIDKWDSEEFFLASGKSDYSIYNRWHSMFGTREKYLNYWEKCMRRK